MFECGRNQSRTPLYFLLNASLKNVLFVKYKVPIQQEKKQQQQELNPPNIVNYIRNPNYFAHFKQLQQNLPMAWLNCSKKYPNFPMNATMRSWVIDLTHNETFFWCCLVRSKSKFRHTPKLFLPWCPMMIYILSPRQFLVWLNRKIKQMNKHMFIAETSVKFFFRMTTRRNKTTPVCAYAFSPNKNPNEQLCLFFEQIPSNK